MQIINNVLYTQIFGEMAKFLVEKTIFKVYFVFYEVDDKPKVLLTKENIDFYVNIEEENERLRIVKDGALFLCQEFYEDGLTVISNKKGVKINSSNIMYPYLNFK